MYHVDEATGVGIKSCYDCDVCDEYRDAVGYHTGCLDVWETQLLPPPALHKAAFYSYMPSPLEDARRRNRIRALLLGKLPAMLPNAALPPELWSMIAGRLVAICATTTWAELWEGRDSDSDELDCARGVWARYVCIEGARYIAQLTNAPPEETTKHGAPAAVCLLTAQAAAAKTVVYVLEDYLGVRQLVFAEPDRDMSWLAAQADLHGATDVRNVLYWRTLQLLPRGRLSAFSDGLKIRTVRTRAADEEPYFIKSKTMVWSIPIAPSAAASLAVVNYTPLDPRLEVEEWGDARMASCLCNAPDVTGYSAFWSQNLRAIHAHRSGGDDDLAALYRHFDHTFDGFGLWVYFALGPGERIEHIFGRRGRHDCHKGLLLRTNRGRDMVLGPGLPVDGVRADDHGAKLRYQYIGSLPPPADTPTRIHYNVSPHGIRKLVFERAKTIRRPPLPPVRPATLVRNPTFARSEAYFVSTVDLDGVARIVPSYKQNKHFDRVFLCGLLVHYAAAAADGRRPPASFGEVRLDNVGAALDVAAAGADTLYLGYFHDGRVSTHLLEVSLRPRANDRTMTWFAVPLRGQAELWFSGLHSIVYHETLDPNYRTIKSKDGRAG
ncbi:hypothetical protein SPI_02790 [Niveomyces insectorum RCEF 264]|uniref:Uncharacterized protein n=1 Tax=Niveomyces insectorum RCEF 264 TaxID=1081102 RepID=A0A167Y950_9HYPO|nr:hypothetical protein SPI_02790 [Niveomyces insectorum RCEF 264]